MHYLEIKGDISSFSIPYVHASAHTKNPKTYAKEGKKKCCHHAVQPIFTTLPSTETLRFLALPLPLLDMAGTAANLQMSPNKTFLQDSFFPWLYQTAVIKAKAINL